MKQIKIGRIAGAAGLKGEVKLYHESGDAESLSRASTLFLCNNQALRTMVPYNILSLRVHGRTPILGLSGVIDRSAAEALIGSEVYVDEDAIRPAEEDAYLVSDLIGLSVIDTATGDEIGLVQGIVDNPAHDLLEVAKGGGGILLIPMADVFIKEIDLTSGRILAEVTLLLR
ncbi:MAG: ribosome maturation factor RimM [Clostridiales Family XIII bacterium]|jgi:16S rRNA processing protein RimM|nr:ribosome maturation factor RimM [Clostridiales Family XIII bacterium]